MILEHIGLSQINGSLVVLDGVKGVQYDEMAELHLDDGSTRVGRVVEVEGDRCIIQVFEGTRGLSLVNNCTVLTGHPMMMDLSPELPGRVLDGLGRPIDGLGDIYPTARRDVNGAPINPVSRVYPRNYIHTGISSIDCLATLIRGQKLPIFSGSGMKHKRAGRPDRPSGQRGRWLGLRHRLCRYGRQKRRCRLLPGVFRELRRDGARGHAAEPGQRPHHRAYHHPARCPDGAEYRPLT